MLSYFQLLEGIGSHPSLGIDLSSWPNIDIDIQNFVTLRLSCAFPVVYRIFCAILIGVYDLFKLQLFSVPLSCLPKGYFCVSLTSAHELLLQIINIH